jgi:hypothetical protein
MIRHELTLGQANDETLELVLVESDTGGAYDLTGAGVEVVLKAAAGVPDTEAIILTSPDVDITDPEAGEVEVAISRSHLQDAGCRWWRVDVVRPGTRRTALYGPLQVVDL